MDSTSVLNSALKNENELFLSKLSSYTIIDIGTIVEVKDGRALVHGSSFKGGLQSVYENAEIIYPGNEGGAYVTESAGTPCLIFIPSSCMPDVSTRKVRLHSAPYSREGIKVLPISNGTGALVKTVFDAGGTYSIVTKNYSLSFTEDTINLERKDAAASISMGTEGDLHVIKQGQYSTHYFDEEDGISSDVWLSEDKTKQWTSELHKDGSRKLTLTNPDAETAPPMLSIEISNSGAVTLSGDVTGHISVSGDTVVDITGDAKVDVSGDAKINATNIELNGKTKHFVTYEELKLAMDKLWIAMTTTPIIGDGSPQGTWTGLPTGIDISASKTNTIKTGG